MAKILGLGGLFFKSVDPAALAEWYGRVLGISFEDWGGVVFLPDTAAAQPGAATIFSPFKIDSDYFAPSDKDYMFNLMVDDLDLVFAALTPAHKHAHEHVRPIAGLRTTGTRVDDEEGIATIKRAFEEQIEFVTGDGFFVVVERVVNLAQTGLGN